MERLRVTFAAVRDEYQNGGAILALVGYTGEYDMRADELGLHVKTLYEGGTRLYPWHAVESLVYVPDALPNPSLHDLETGACKCERKDDVTREGTCGYCKHGQHVERKYCGALR